MNPYATCFAAFDAAKAIADATFVAEMSAATTTAQRQSAIAKWRDTLQAALRDLEKCMANVDDRPEDDIDLCDGANP